MKRNNHSIEDLLETLGDFRKQVTDQSRVLFERNRRYGFSSFIRSLINHRNELIKEMQDYGIMKSVSLLNPPNSRKKECLSFTQIMDISGKIATKENGSIDYALPHLNSCGYCRLITLLGIHSYNLQ